MSEPYKFKPVKVSCIIDDPEEAEHFLRGLIVAKSNNSSPYFQEIIDGINSTLEKYREAKLAHEMEQRRAAGMP